ncbi:MAG: AI-2E family transporter [Anaerolineae bacterium]|nr:AI-2E family transporter [Anaerolineae bacterium]
MTETSHSPNWNNTTKIFVAAFALVVAVLTAWRFQQLITTLLVAGIITYILNPVVVWVERRTPFHRGVAIAIVYPLFALIIIGILFAIGLSVYQQSIGLLIVIQDLILRSPALIRQIVHEPLTVGPSTIYLNQIEFDLVQVTRQAISSVQPLLSQSAQFLGAAASITLGWVGWAILIFVLSIYIQIDFPRFGRLIRTSATQPGYRRDIELLLRDTRKIWDGFLRGQTILSLLLAVVYTIIFQLLGLRYALVLGILGGLLDFLPYIGPTVITLLSVLVAVFQGSNWLGLSPMAYGLVMLLIGIAIQQIEGNWLKPRVMGDATGLHPLLVIIGAIMGGSLAGVLGVILATPTLATLKLITIYAWRKMFDLNPFPEPYELPPDFIADDPPLTTEAPKRGDVVHEAPHLEPTDQPLA